MLSRFLLTLVLLAVVSSPVAAQSAYPMITHTEPTAVQRGQTTEVTVSGRMDFRGARQVLFDQNGIHAEVTAATSDKPVTSVKLRVTVTPEATLGVKEFRIATDKGISTLGQLLIADEAIVPDTDGKTTLTELPAVVCGRIEKPEDVDECTFEGKAGQRLTVEMFCARLQDKIHDLQAHADPLLALYDSTGRELAANDDGIFADPLLAYTLPSDGTYILKIRDAKYAGDPRWTYAVRMTDRPYVRQIVPMALNPGQTIKVIPVDAGGVEGVPVELTAPDSVGIHEVTPRIDGNETNPTGVIVTPLELVAEQDGNDTPEHAQRLTLPCGVNGRLVKDRELDHYRFQGEKGKPVRFTIFARRFGTPLTSDVDAVLELFNENGNLLASADDDVGKDPILSFTPKEDGEYVVRVRDLHGRGGATCGYFLAADFAPPDFSLSVDPSKAMVGPGGRAAWYVQVKRENGFAGGVTVSVDGLPEGVNVTPLTIPASMTQGVLVLDAVPDAKPNASVVTVRGTGTIDGTDVSRRADSREEIYMPGGGRGLFGANMQAVAVTEPLDILDIQVSPAEVILKPGEEVQLDITIQRREDFTQDVTLDVLLRHLNRVYADPLPPGVKIVEGKSKTRLGKGNVGHIVLKADPKATPTDAVPVNVQAYVSINFVVKVGYSSAPIPITIRQE